MPFSRANRPLTLSIAAVVASLVVVAIGAQAYLAQQDNKARDRADRRYADCLTRFAADLVDSIRDRTDASVELDKARDRKDELLDQLISISARAQATGAKTQDDLPPALVRRYEKVLRERVDAQHEFNRLARRFEQTRQDNPYVAPQVVCSR